MALVLSLVNQKGGVGKTTTAVNLAAYLAQLGRTVLLVDIDPQANASSGLGIDHRALDHGIYDALVGTVPLHAIIRDTALPTLRVAPATSALAGANVELVNVMDREWKLTQLLAQVSHAYDFIIIDCPPSLGPLTINGLIAADHLLIPVQAEYYALEGLGQLLETINLVRENLKPELEIMGAIITMFDPRNKLAQDVLHELYKFFPNKIFRSVIPRSVRLAEAPSHGKSILEYDPESRAATAYERLARELLTGLEAAVI